MRKYYLFLFVVLVSCYRGEMSPEEAAEAKTDVLSGIDYVSYVHLGNFFAESQTKFSIERMPYDLVMARDSTCIGCYQFYYNFLKASFKNKYQQSNIYKLEKPEQELLLYYLKKGAKKEDDYCREALIQFYQNGKDRNKLKADSILKLMNLRSY